MCMIELEPCDVWEVKQVTARKEHRCASCHAPISPGERYTRTFSVFEGAAAAEKACAHCQAISEAFADAHEGMVSNPSYLPMLLVECISDGDEDSEIKWNPMLAALRERQASARSASRATPPEKSSGVAATPAKEEE